MGTCAAAAATGSVVETPDFRADDKWTELRHLPLALGFVGAWSCPIKSPSGAVLGTFGTYFRERREPTSEERRAAKVLAEAAAKVLGKSAPPGGLREVTRVERRYPWGMYTVDDRDAVQPLERLPQSSVGAPLPHVVCDEGSTLLAYLSEVVDPHWDGTTCREVGPESAEESAVVLRFTHCSACMFGPPGDEVVHGHPLGRRGLEAYGAFEVVNSSWVRALERMNSVHPNHMPERFKALRHFILTFHDSTFECVAEGVEVAEVVRGSMREAATRMVKMLGRGG